MGRGRRVAEDAGRFAAGGTRRVSQCLWPKGSEGGGIQFVLVSDLALEEREITKYRIYTTYLGESVFDDRRLPEERGGEHARFCPLSEQCHII